MTDEAFGRPLPLCGHHHCGQRQFGAHMVAHGPADDLAGRQVEHRGEIQPSFPGRDESDVCQPDAVRRRRHEFLLQQVRRDGQIVAAVGHARPEPATGERANTVTMHQPRNAATTRRPAFRAKRRMHPGAAVAAMMLAMEATHVRKQRAVGACPGAFWAVAPCVIAAGRDLKDPAHQPDWPLAGMVADELKAHLGTSAKMPIAFLVHRAPYAYGRVHASAG